jgi:hypothetical protein
MPKNPEPPAEPPPPPPDHLSARSQELWTQLIHDAKTRGRQVYFQAALEALDRADEARAAIAKDGMTWTTPTTGAIHVNPLIRVEKEARAQFLAA